MILELFLISLILASWILVLHLLVPHLYADLAGVELGHLYVALGIGLQSASALHFVDLPHNVFLVILDVSF